MSRVGQGARGASLVALLAALGSCGGTAATEDPLAAVPIRVDAELVEPPPLRVEWTVRSMPPAGDGSPPVTQDRDEDADEDGTLVQPPALDGELAYVPYARRVRALRVADGSVAWDVHLPADPVLAPVALASGIAVADAGGWTWIDRGGGIVGRLSITGRPLAAVGAGDLVIVVDGESVVGIQGPDAAAPPAIAWTFPLPGARAPALGPDGQVVVVTAGDAGVAAVSVGDGRLRWHRTDLVASPARAAIGERRAYVVDMDSRVRALDLQDGDTGWTSKAIGVRVIGAPVAVDRLVWVAGLDAALYAYDSGSGSHLFRIPTSGRVYIDLTSWRRWVVVSPQYGPWSLVRGPLQRTGPAEPGAPRGITISPGETPPGDLTLAPAIGPPGVLLSDGRGTIHLLRPPPWARD